MGFLSHTRHLSGLQRHYLAVATKRPPAQLSSLNHYVYSCHTIAPTNNNNFGQYQFKYYSSTTNPWMGSKAKMGIGGNNWSRMDPTQYQAVIAKSIEHGISVIEAGQEGGDRALMEAYHKALQKQGGDLSTEDYDSDDYDSDSPLTLTLRIGYRTITPEDKQQQQQPRFRGDVEVEQHPFMGPNRPMALDEDRPAPSPEQSSPQDSEEDQMMHIYHNISDVYIQKQIATSPLVKEYQKQNTNGAMRVVALLHNPEAQIMEMAMEQDINKVKIEERQQFLRDRMVDAFCALEDAVAKQEISSYGIVSNGIVLPSKHPLSLSVDTILEAVNVAMEKRNSNGGACHLSVLQVPINLMERTGLDVARDLHRKLQEDEQYQHLREFPPLEIYAMRPLTCYPDRGTGTGHAFQLVDYLLPTGPQEHDGGDDDKKKKDNDKKSNIEKGEELLDDEDGEKVISDEELASKQWSNKMSGPPLIYSIALKKAMQHFDAAHLLEEKMKRELTGEERETLDGCKLLQSMLHDLDAGLAKVRSLGAHEEHLYQQIIPLIHDTFEGYDEETADVLEMFFKSYSLAVRYAIARNTRELLKKGGDSGSEYKYKDIPDDEKLQDYALKYLMKEEAISKVIVGTTKPEHVVGMVTMCYRLDDELDDSETKE